jgi:hypothetical protein
MKRSLLTGFRAIAFALGAFVLLAMTGIEIRSSRDVAIFVLGLAVFWFLIERVFLNMRQKGTKKPGG